MRSPSTTFVMICVMLLGICSASRGGKPRRPNAMRRPALYTAWVLPLYIDVSAHWGITKMDGEVPGANSPTLMQWQLGITFAANLSRYFFIGGTTDVRYLGQYSTVSLTVGNFRGVRWNFFSPTIGMRFGPVTIKTDFQLAGNYYLSNKTVGNGVVTFISPQGWRIMLLYKFTGKHEKGFFFGVHYEQVKFAKKDGTIHGRSDLDPKLKIWQVGTNLGYIF